MQSHKKGNVNKVLTVRPVYLILSLSTATLFRHCYPVAYLLAAEKEKYFFFFKLYGIHYGFICDLIAVQKLGGIWNDIICAHCHFKIT